MERALGHAHSVAIKIFLGGIEFSSNEPSWGTYYLPGPDRTVEVLRGRRAYHVQREGEGRFLSSVLGPPSSLTWRWKPEKSGVPIPGCAQEPHHFRES